PTEDFAYNPHPARDLGLVRWTVGAGAAGLILAALASIWNVQIRRQVRKRTRELHDEVSHRLEVESELRANEKRFRLMFAGAATGIVVVAPAGRFINANPAYCAMVGYSESELQEMDFTSLTHPIERAQNVVSIERLLCGDADHFILEQRCLKKDGTAFWVRASVSIVRTAAGKPMKLIAVTEDISGRKSAEEEAQRASEVQAGIVQVQQEIASASLGLQAVMDLIAERARTLTDADGGVVELIEGHEMVYRATAGLAEREIGLRLKREGSLSGEVARNGKVLICEDSELDDRVDRAACRKVKARSMVVAPLRANEQVIGVLKVLSERPYAFTKRDVSNLQILVESLGAVIQRQQADAKVREQAALLDKAQDAILVRRLDHRITYWNKSAERLYGWTAKEAFALEGVERLYQDGDAFKEACIHVEQTGEWFGELKQTSKCGRSLIVEGRWTLVRNHDGEPSEILSINTDITEKKELEHQFLRAQRMESIGTLAGGIAHDLNNVLAPIMMGIGLLKMTERDEMRLGILSTIDLSAERGADMLRQLLTFARGVEGKRLEIDVKNLVDDIENIVNETFLKYIRIRTVIPGDLWSLRGDPTQLHQVLLNLCMNARDAMPEGGMLKVVLRNFEADAAFALLHADAKPCSYIVIRVEDNGMGMQSDVLERIFDPFYTTKELGKGTGLGLSTSLAIVKSHGGFINVQTEVGSGSVFEIYLPAQIERPEDTAPVIEAVAAHGNDELILVVDDEASIREVTQEMLETFGYRVLVASDGEDALAIYASRPEEIAVVISDMMMPGMDGAATIRALLQMNPDLPIIAASGLSAAGQGAIADQLGAQFFLSKPYSAESLLKTLRQAIHAQRD
ncbi:MAG: hypothetical protein JWL90_4445, partial [Chthoniobacteraceae bacterium]|nr:hypothetical protein [Chthoniobacteraceae bacterium]